MRIIRFSVENFRSITKAYKLSLGNKAILIGPNNEGKSNILSAIGLTFRAITEYNPVLGLKLLSSRQGKNAPYDWGRDYPLQLQELDAKGKSVFLIEFEFESDELDEFNTITSGNWSKTLSVSVSFGLGAADIEISTKGRAKKAINQKKHEVLIFVRKYINFQYIPAVRGKEYLSRLIDGLIADQLAPLESDKEFLQAIELIERRRRPILKELANQISFSVKDFISSVKSINLKSSENTARHLNSSVEIFIDDGVETPLERKGDGVKSLVAVSLVKFIAEKGKGSRRVVLAIEEPEVHLHPKAIHKLKSVLDDLSGRMQLVITTHSPILVDRTSIGNNVVVSAGRAVPSKNIGSLRDILGVMVSDNLINANKVLLVEGLEDKIIIEHFLCLASKPIAHLIKNGALVIVPLNGASHLSSYASIYNNMLCNVSAFVDDDVAGRAAESVAISSGILASEKIQRTILPGRKNTELEDLIDPDVYCAAIKLKYGVDLQANSKFRSTAANWSDRVALCFRMAGVDWTSVVENEVKKIVCENVIVLRSLQLREPVGNIISTLVNKLL